MKSIVALVLAGIIAVGILASAAAVTVPRKLIPIHGAVVLQRSPARVILRNDPVTEMLSSQTREYRAEATSPLSSGEQIDAYIDRATRPWTLRDIQPGGPYYVGQAFPDVKRFLRPGDKVPDVLLVDQSGRPTRFPDFAGKTVLLTFVYTRCTDICPVITKKFAKIGSKLSPKRFHLVELTIDPNYDSPAILAAYAKKYGADGANWSFLTGTPNSAGRLLAQFGITDFRASTSTNAIVGDVGVKATDALIDHNQPLVIIGFDGRITSIIQNAALSPNDIIAQARHDAGMWSNPLRRS